RCEPTRSTRYPTGNCAATESVGNRQREANVDKTDAELRRQERKKRRQDQILKVVDEVSQRDHRERTVFRALLAWSAVSFIINLGCRSGGSLHRRVVLPES